MYEKITDFLAEAIAEAIVHFEWVAEGFLVILLSGSIGFTLCYLMFPVAGLTYMQALTVALMVRALQVRPQIVRTEAPITAEEMALFEASVDDEEDEEDEHAVLH